MLNKRSSHFNKGFTLAELLIVVAIIAILTSVSIPVFTGRMNKVRLATNMANARSAYAAAANEHLLNPGDPPLPALYKYADGQLTRLSQEKILEYQNTPSDGELNPWQTAGFTLETNFSEWSVIKMQEQLVESWEIIFYDDGETINLKANY